MELRWKLHIKVCAKYMVLKGVYIYKQKNYITPTYMLVRSLHVLLVS
jgi:hypothetical protein